MKFRLFGLWFFLLLLIWLVSFSFIYLLICFDSSLPFSLYILPPLLLKCGQGCVGPQQRASKVSLSCKQFTLISLTFISFFFFIQTRFSFCFNEEEEKKDYCSRPLSLYGFSFLHRFRLFSALFSSVSLIYLFFFIYYFFFWLVDRLRVLTNRSLTTNLIFFCLIFFLTWWFLFVVTIK